VVTYRRNALNFLAFRGKPFKGPIRRSSRAKKPANRLNGLELLPRAKAARPDVPIKMINAYGDAETKRKALEGGAEALLTKPIDFATLRNEIGTRVERAA
jgi:CheY-like chemotaxis protein